MCWSLVGTICACRLKKRMGALSVPTCNGVGWVCCAYINVLCVADVVCKSEGAYTYSDKCTRHLADY